MSSQAAAPFLTSLMNSEKYSDLKIICGDNSYKVHRAIICPQSEYFSKLCDGLFKEANTGVVHLHEDKPEHVARMIDYFYTGDYDDNKNYISVFASANDAQLINTSVYALGEKYLVPGLKSVARSKFESRAVGSWASGADYVVRTVYSTTPSTDAGLRTAVATACATLEREALSSVLHDLPEFKIDYLEAQLRLKTDRIADLENRLTKIAEKRGWNMLITKINEAGCEECGRRENIRVNPAKSSYDTGFVWMQCLDCIRR